MTSPAAPAAPAAPPDAEMNAAASPVGWKTTRKMPPGRGSTVASLPIHWTSLAGSVKYENTISGPAAIVTVCSMTLVARGVAPPLLGLGRALQPLQPGGHDLGEEALQVREPIRPDAVEPPLRLAALLDEAGVAEHLEVLRDRGLADLEARRDLACAQLAAGQKPEDLAALGLGDRVEDLHEAPC